MDHVIGLERSQSQLLPACLEDYVSQDAPVRVIDAFVETLDFEALGFEHARPKERGRPAYHPGTLLKLYIYGYLNRVRTSRRLEQETKRNLELKWLLQGLEPDHKTISNFRRNNRTRFRKIFRKFNLLCRELKLFEAELVAIYGSKFKAVSNRRNHHTRKQLQKALDRIDQRISQYLEDLDREDERMPRQAKETKGTLKEKLASMKSKQARLEETLKELEESGANEIGIQSR